MERMFEGFKLGTAKLVNRFMFPPIKLATFGTNTSIHEHIDKKVVRMTYTKGNEGDFLRWGEFRFRISDKEQVLQAYRSNPKEERLFILFKDLTSGKETYGAGRYLDLEPERNHTPEGRWILDFNRAYNPWCVYSKDYT